MKTLERGHIYELNSIDGTTPQRLVFVNREAGTEHEGTQTQEVLRSLIDRTYHCHQCRPWKGNESIIYHLRMALVLHEARALIRKVQEDKLQPETIAVSSKDGHFKLTEEIPCGRNLTYSLDQFVDPLSVEP